MYQIENDGVKTEGGATREDARRGRGKKGR